MKNFILVLALMSAGSADAGLASGEDITTADMKDVAGLIEDARYVTLLKKLARIEAKQDCMIAAINAGAPESVNGCLKKKSVDSRFYVNPNSIGGGGGSSGSGKPALAH